MPEVRRKRGVGWWGAGWLGADGRAVSRAAGDARLKRQVCAGAELRSAEGQCSAQLCDTVE